MEERSQSISLALLGSHVLPSGLPARKPFTQEVAVHVKPKLQLIILTQTFPEPNWD